MTVYLDGDNETLEKDVVYCPDCSVDVAVEHPDAQWYTYSDEDSEDSNSNNETPEHKEEIPVSSSVKSE